MSILASQATSSIGPERCARLRDMDGTDISSVSSSREVGVRATTKKKTYNLDEVVIEKARRLFNVKTKTEAIHRALQKAVEDQEIQDALARLLQKGRFRTLYR